MEPFYIMIGDPQKLLVIPDTQAHLNGHAVLTHTYHLYHHSDHDDRLAIDRESTRHLNKKDDPHYLGTITFDAPGKLFTYSRGHRKLSGTEVEEAIEEISHFRDNSNLWPKN
ncbi:MAG: hypothetical protein JKY70_18275 [Mucilaginibacter sp.]|nr:hypothetical protein [Mucilaginibacter sp.]